MRSTAFLAFLVACLIGYAIAESRKSKPVPEPAAEKSDPMDRLRQECVVKVESLDPVKRIIVVSVTGSSPTRIVVDFPHIRIKLEDQFGNDYWVSLVSDPIRFLYPEQKEIRKYLFQPLISERDLRLCLDVSWNGSAGFMNGYVLKKTTGKAEAE